MNKNQEDFKIKFIKVTRNGKPLMINIDHIVSIRGVNEKAEIQVTNRETPYRIDQSYEDMTYLIPDNYSLEELEK